MLPKTSRLPLPSPNSIFFFFFETRELGASDFLPFSSLCSLGFSGCLISSRAEKVQGRTAFSRVIFFFFFFFFLWFFVCLFVCLFVGVFVEGNGAYGGIRGA